MEDLDTTRAGSTAAGTSRSSEGAQGRASADETCEDATTPQNDFYETLVSRYQAKATELAALTAHNQLARLQRSSRLQDNESLNLAASSANPVVRTSVGVGNRHPFPVTASAMSTESNAQLVSRNADSSGTLASAPAPSSQSSAQLLSRSALSAEADRSSPHKRWAEALQRSAESELKKLFPGIHQVSAIIKEFLSCACQLTVVTIRKKLDQAERLLKNCSVRKFIASYAKVVYTTQLSLADQRFLEATVRTNLNYIGNATDGGRKGVLVRAFVGVYREDLANNAKAFSTSLSAKGHVHEGFSFGEGPPSTLVHYLVVALLLYAVPLFTPDPSGEAGIEIHPVVAPQDRDFLTWIQTVLKAAVKVPQREPAPQIKYDSYEMGDVAARVAEAIIDESDRRCETIRMNLRNSGCERDTNTGTHALRAIDKTSVYGKIAEVVNDPEYVIEPSFSRLEAGVDPSRAPETNDLKLNESSARALLSKMKMDFQAATQVASSSGFNDSNPFSDAASRGATLRTKYDAKGSQPADRLENHSDDSASDDDNVEHGGHGGDNADAAEIGVVEKGQNLRETLARKCELHVDAVLYLKLLANEDDGLLSSILSTSTLEHSEKCLQENQMRGSARHASQSQDSDNEVTHSRNSSDEAPSNSDNSDAEMRATRPSTARESDSSSNTPRSGADATRRRGGKDSYFASSGASSSTPRDVRTFSRTKLSRKRRRKVAEKQNIVDLTGKAVSDIFKNVFMTAHDSDIRAEALKQAKISTERQRKAAEREDRIAKDEEERKREAAEREDRIAKDEAERKRKAAEREEQMAKLEQEVKRQKLKLEAQEVRTARIAKLREEIIETTALLSELSQITEAERSVIETSLTQLRTDLMSALKTKAD